MKNCRHYTVRELKELLSKFDDNKGVAFDVDNEIISCIKVSESPYEVIIEVI